MYEPIYLITREKSFGASLSGGMKCRDETARGLVIPLPEA